MKLYATLKVGDEPDFLFYCPGCKCDHGIWTTESHNNKAIWNFNGDLNKPTVSPSILVRYNKDGKDMVCHSFIVCGEIQFLNDCTHELAGKTVPLEEYE